MEYYLYVSGTADGRLARFLMDGSSGRKSLCCNRRPHHVPGPVGAQDRLTRLPGGFSRSSMPEDRWKNRLSMKSCLRFPTSMGRGASTVVMAVSVSPG